jgi:tetratricopeptide (TPR) repeat protein
MRDPNVLNMAAWTCALAPEAVSDYGPLVKVCDALLERNPGVYALLSTAGAIRYRAGDFPEALKHLNAAIEAAGDQAAAVDWLFLAMTQFRLNQTENAAEWFERAAAWSERETNQRTQGPMGARLRWEERLELQLLLHEAETVLHARD